MLPEYNGPVRGKRSSGGRRKLKQMFPVTQEELDWLTILRDRRAQLNYIPSMVARATWDAWMQPAREEARDRQRWNDYRDYHEAIHHARLQREPPPSFFPKKRISHRVQKLPRA